MNYHNIDSCNMLNGEGLRVVLWVSGCPYRCKGCFNPETHDPNSGIPFDNNAYRELVDALSKDYIDGITFLGGSPLAPYNIETVTELAKELREKFPNKTQWCYTGNTWDNVKDFEIMKYLDVLVDGPFVETLKDNNCKWRGSSNQRVIDVKESLKTGSAVLHADN